MSAKLALAATIGMSSISELNEYRYQNYASPLVFAVGDKYFAVSKKQPKHDVGGPWGKHSDQFFAERNSTVIWVADAQ